MIKPFAYRRLPWYTWAMLLVIVAVLVRVALGVWNTFTPAQPLDTAPAAAAVSGDATQTNEGGQVTIKATWQGLSAGRAAGNAGHYGFGSVCFYLGLE